MTNRLASWLLLTGMMMNHPPEITPSEPRVIKKTVPKGCKIYKFNDKGDIVDIVSTYCGSTYYFDCVAFNEKSARRKFNKFITQQSN